MTGMTKLAGSSGEAGPASDGSPLTGSGVVGGEVDGDVEGTCASGSGEAAGDVKEVLVPEVLALGAGSCV